MIKKDIFITGINLDYATSPEDVDDDTFIEVSFTDTDNNMVLKTIIPLSIVKNMNFNGKYELIINKVE